MNLRAPFVKLRSLAPWPAVLASAIALVSGAPACLIVADDPNAVAYPPADDVPVLTSIDADKTLNADPGTGAGVFVEYTTGGSWRIWTTCDTLKSGYSCVYDVCVAVADGTPELTRASGEALEAGDSVTSYGDGWTCLLADTDLDTDGMTFDASPGSIVRLDAQLGGDAVPQLVFWVGDGVLHEGAPSNPLDLQPSTP